MTLQIPIRFKSNFTTQPSFPDIKASLEALLLSGLKDHLSLSPSFFEDPAKWVRDHPEERAKCFCELNERLAEKDDIIYCVFTDLPKIPTSDKNIDLENMFYALNCLMRELEFQNLRVVAEVEYEDRNFGNHYVFPTISLWSRVFEKFEVAKRNGDVSSFYNR